MKGDSIAEWLESGSGVYWISGKAGSGKSTLMKHLFWDLEETDRQSLRHFSAANISMSLVIMCW